MAAYIVFILDKMKDRERFDEYHRIGRPASAGHPIERLAYYGKHETLEGLPSEGVVLFRFPSMEAAHAWYDSPAYQAALPVRREASDFRVLLFEGV